MSEYTADDYIVFIESDRRDKVSPDGLAKIAEEYRRLQEEAKIDTNDILEKFIIWYWRNIDHGQNSMNSKTVIDLFNIEKKKNDAKKEDNVQ